jgi:major capsid protein gp7
MNRLVLILAVSAAALLVSAGNTHAAILTLFVGSAASVDWQSYRPEVFGTGLNFLQLAIANSNDIVGGLIEENATESPELNIFDSEDMAEPGVLSYETLHRTSLPTASFASAGNGFDASRSEIKLVPHQCFRFGGRIEAAKHIADNWRRGGAAGYQAHEASGIMKAAMQLIGRQIFYGVSNDGLGFPGMKAFTPFGASYTYDATGSTATTASSVYYVKFGEAFARLMIGRARNGSGIFDLPDFQEGDILGANSKAMRAYISELSSYVGLQIASPFSVLRLCNLTAQSGKTLSDLHIATAKQLMPSGWVPDVCFMSKRSKFQLQTSRTVTLFGAGSDRPTQGLIAPAPTTDADGVPIVWTDSILNTDAIES